MYVTDLIKPVPILGQALVKVRAFGLNRMDLLQREGLYPLPPQAPETMGVEFSGVIEQFGDDAASAGSEFKFGDEVFGLAYGGTYLAEEASVGSASYSYRIGAYAEYIVVSTKTLFHKPVQLSWEEAAGIPEVCMPV